MKAKELKVFQHGLCIFTLTYDTAVTTHSSINELKVFNSSDELVYHITGGYAVTDTDIVLPEQR